MDRGGGKKHDDLIGSDPDPRTGDRHSSKDSVRPFLLCDASNARMGGTMNIRAGTLIGLLISITYPSSAQQGLTLTVGQLNYLESVQGIEQHFSVKNKTQSVIGSVMVSCGFFSNGQLIATERTLIENIAGNATGFGKVFVFSNISPDRTQCRIGPTF